MNKVDPEHEVYGEPQPSPRNNPGYTPEYKELESAREAAKALNLDASIENDPLLSLQLALRWLAAEVRVMRLERALGLGR